MAMPPPTAAALCGSRHTVRIRALHISGGHNFFGHHGRPPGDAPAVRTDALECVAGRGIRGDRFFDYKPDYKGQITFFSEDVFRLLCSELNLRYADPAGTRRNVIVGGFPLADLIGRRFSLQEVEFEGTEECRPCYWMNSSLGAGAEEWLRGRGGLRARILSDGTLHAASSAQLVIH